jgi:hypothetical protein
MSKPLAAITRFTDEAWPPIVPAARVDQGMNSAAIVMRIGKIAISAPRRWFRFMAGCLNHSMEHGDGHGMGKSDQTMLGLVMVLWIYS